MADSTPGGRLPTFNPSRTAVVNKPLTVKLAPAAGEDHVAVLPSKVGLNKLELRVHSQSRGLLVLSETYYPGWHATVNGTPEEIYQVDGDLRGVIVPTGDSNVVLTYAPVSVYGGGSLGLLAFAATLFCWMKCRSRLAL